MQYLQNKFLNMRKEKKNFVLENISIIDVAEDGMAIAKHDDKVIFVKHAVPGDVCDIKIFKNRKNYLEGLVIKTQHYSSKRTEAFCSHFGTCGGCKWQDLKYEEQLFYKQKRVMDCFSRIGKIYNPAIDPIVASSNKEYYRNKLEYTFSNYRWLTANEMNIDNLEMNALGFHIPGKFDKVLNIEKCFLQSEFSNLLRNEIREFAIKNKYPFFDIRKKEGLLRNLIVRTSNNNQIMVIVVFYVDDNIRINELMIHIGNKFPQITSLLYAINNKANDSLTGEIEIIHFKGENFIFESMNALTFRIGPLSFFQTNSTQAYNLYKKTSEFADIKNTDTIYDLYTGTGTIANFVANDSKKVIGIEYVEQAILDARVNSEINNIHNTVFFAGDMKDLLNKKMYEKEGHPDVIITDPPRAGMHPDVISAILESDAKRIVYVSCNPSTQARDIEMLSEKYCHIKSCPFDMFPHTHHVENVSLLERK
jgi:23S rRNA (uracil1939-C5)-methyltransferase